MIDYYKSIDESGIVSGFGTNGPDGMTEITEPEYNALAAMFSERPAAPDGYAYVIRDNPREWVLIELPPESDPELTGEEALAILLGEGGAAE